MTKQDIVAEVVKRTGLSKTEAEVAVETVVEGKGSVPFGGLFDTPTCCGRSSRRARHAVKYPDIVSRCSQDIVSTLRSR